MEAGRPADRERLLMRAAEEKVPGGKLVQVSIAPDGCVEITGDFFAHPEEGIAQIERVLGCLNGTEPAGEIELVLSRFVASSGIELIGVDVPAIARLYQACLTGAINRA